MTVVDAGKRKALELRVEVPVEDMARLAEPVEPPEGEAAAGPGHASIWTAIHPRLLELVRAHRSTLLFVNSRRVAERLAAALNELAGETLVHAHHGSLARPQRVAIEEALKAGAVRGLVATSSLELGIDMGAIDLVIQIEAAPSVASALQRIGRAGHQLDAASKGVFFPKYRADLLACAAQIEAMWGGEVEETRFPRNPLDVLAQQVVALASLDEWPVDELYRLVRRAAPFAGLSRPAFEGVLDLLSGRYPSDELSDLQPRLVWDRVRGRVRAREGARRVAVVNAGTIPNRGLYAVFLVGAPPGQGRVGELDEEMVFESKVGDTFYLGASTWRIEEITHDRVLVSPAPGEPGRMPFWKGDAPGRPLELGRRIGRLARELSELPGDEARSRLVERHALDERAARNLLQFLADQRAATGAIPDDRTVVVERCKDELGDWRVCVLSPFGAPVLVPWCLAAAARAREQLGIEAETIWTNDGFAVRVPDAGNPPDVSFLFPEPEEVEAIVTAQLAATPLFAGKFREAAGRALLLPRRRPGGRTPLWQRRKRAHDLLSVASRFPDFPILLESYRECLRDVFDLPALVDLMAEVRRGEVRIVTADTRVPSPFASSLLFGFVASFLYDGDAPLAERRAQALAIDQVQLRELLGEAELRELLDAPTIRELEQRLQLLAPEPSGARSPDGLAESPPAPGRSLAPGGGRPRGLARGRGRPRRPGGRGQGGAAGGGGRAALRGGGGRRALPGRAGGEPPRRPARGAAGQGGGSRSRALLARFARRRGPFTTGEAATRFGLSPHAAEAGLEALLRRGRLLEGAFRPGGREREWCDPEVLRTMRRRSLARLREEVEPVEPAALGRALLAWHGIPRRRGGLDAVLDAVEKLQGAPLPASALESELLPARVEGYLPGDLDALAADGEVLWVGLEPVGARDGRVALFLSDALPRLLPAPPGPAPEGERERRILDHLSSRGASFFPELHAAAGGGFAPETVEALWALVWSGLVTNDTFQVLRAFTEAPARRERARHAVRPPGPGGYRSRLAAPPSAGGRWTLVEARRSQAGGRVTPTAWSAATAHQLLARHGVLTRGAVLAEGLPGGFGAVYEVLRHLEEAGRNPARLLRGWGGRDAVRAPGGARRRPRSARAAGAPRRDRAGRGRSRQPLRRGAGLAALAGRRRRQEADAGGGCPRRAGGRRARPVPAGRARPARAPGLAARAGAGAVAGGPGRGARRAGPGPPGQGALRGRPHRRDQWRPGGGSPAGRLPGPGRFRALGDGAATAAQGGGRAGAGRGGVIADRAARRPGRLAPAAPRRDEKGSGASLPRSPGDSVLRGRWCYGVTCTRSSM